MYTVQTPSPGLMTGSDTPDINLQVSVCSFSIIHMLACTWKAARSCPSFQREHKPHLFCVEPARKLKVSAIVHLQLQVSC